MRSTKLVLVLAAVAALAACKKEEVQGPLAGCKTAGYASTCFADADCCSFGCVYGVCAPNPLEDGVCRTRSDCAGGRFCVNERCKTIACFGPGTMCTVGVTPCCGSCSAGFCTGDNAPVAIAGPDLAGAQVPFRIPIQLTNASRDPDNVPSNSGLTYAWTVVAGPAGSSFEPGSTAPAPRFTPAATGAYQLRLTATSGLLSHTDDITFVAVNTPPEVVTMTPDVLGTFYVSRNQPKVMSATVADDDGGPVSCTWAKKGPSDVGYTVVSGPAACAGASGARATGTVQMTLNENLPGTWEVQLGVDDHVNPIVSVSRFVKVLNDPPVVEAGPKRWGNYGLGPIPLSGTATDLNFDVVNLTSGDPYFTWEWKVTTAPAGSGQQDLVLPAATPSTTFTPDHEGTYILTLTADDHELAEHADAGPRGSVGTDTVEVQVEPYILPLGEVADAVYVRGGNKILVADTDAGNEYRLKRVDPATLMVDPTFDVTLAARPIAIGLDPTDAQAIVAMAGGRFQVVTGIGATPAVANTVPAGSGAPADLVDLAHAGACAYGVTASGAVYRLNLAAPGAPYYQAAQCSNCGSFPVQPYDPAGVPFNRAVTGTATVGTTTGPWLWLRNVGTGRIGRYEIHEANCNLQTPYVPASTTTSGMAGKGGLWLSADVEDLYISWTTVYDARSTTLASRFYGLPSIYPDHVETTLDGGGLTGAAALQTTTALSTFSRAAVDGQFTAGSNRAFPSLGWQGNQILNYGQFAFVRTGGGAYYAIVRANVGTTAAPTYRWGLVNLGP